MLRAAAERRLVPRGDDDLPFIAGAAAAGASLLLDTCVYIDRAQGRIPPIVRDTIAVRTVTHSSVALQELLFTVGRLDPNDPRSATAVTAIEAMVRAMPSHRLFTPSVDVLAAASVYAGILSRSQGYAKDDRRRAVNDCALFLQAHKLGLTVLTRNVRDFDLLLQLVPNGRVLLYSA
nr:DNA-binding protein [Enterovirga rhinocerotis]